jgi:hypothetical protein
MGAKGSVRGMGRRTLSLGGVVAGVVALNLLGGSAFAAAPKARDVTSARALVTVITRFDQTALTHESQLNAAAKAGVAHVQASCPGSIPSSVAHGTPKQQAVAFDLVLEGSVDLSVTAMQPIHHAALALAQGLGRTHFSQRTFSHQLHATATIQRRFVTLVPSDFCGDVKAAAAGGFAADPPGTTAFLKRVQRLASSSQVEVPAILKKLGPDLLTAHDRAALKHLKTIDARYETFSTNLGLKWGTKLGSVLAGSPPAGGGTGGFPTGPPAPGSSTMRTALTGAFAAL